MTPHVKLAKDCDKFFKSLGKKCKFIPKHQGVFASQKGISDRLLCYKGKFVAIELKAGNDTATDLQLEFGKEIEEAEGIFVVCYFLDEVKEVIRKIDTAIDCQG